MPAFLVKITQGKWYNDDPPWLKPGEIQSSALFDLRFQDNRLSVWSIEDDQRNLQRVIGALAATRDNIENIDYVLLQQNSLRDLGICIEKSKGGTPDKDANDFHFDLIELTISKIVNVATLIKLSDEWKRVQSFEVKEYLINSFKSGYFDKGMLKEKLLGKLQEMVRLQNQKKPAI